MSIQSQEWSLPWLCHHRKNDRSQSRESPSLTEYDFTEKHQGGPEVSRVNHRAIAVHFSVGYEEPPILRDITQNDLVFIDLKTYSTSLPVLSQLVVGEPLWLYMSASKGALGSVLMR